MQKEEKYRSGLALAGLLGVCEIMWLARPKGSKVLDLM